MGKGSKKQRDTTEDREVDDKELNQHYNAEAKDERNTTLTKGERSQTGSVRSGDAKQDQGSDAVNFEDRPKL